MNKKNLAVIASRLKCVDAISIEAEKWIDKYIKLGYNVHLITGKFGEPTDTPNLALPEIDYKHPEVRGVKRIMFSSKLDKQGRKAVEILLNNLVKRIKGPLKNYLVQNKIQILNIEDALISPKNFPLSIALTEIVKELNMPTISRYHYVPWDAPYFSKFNNFPKLTSKMPPDLKNIVHITSTASAKQKLAEHRKIQSKIIPNTIDMDKLHTHDDYNKDFRRSLGIRDDQLIFLQPTRVKRNKFVERSIKLVAEINDIMKKDNVLILTGAPVYSRGNYFEEVVKKMNKQNVQIIFANDRIFIGRHQNPEQKFYSIHDAYLHADMVLYPNASDAFGNPVIEAAAYRKPLVVDSFPNLKEFRDKGFRFITMNQKVDAELVSDAYEVIMDKEKTKEMTDNNFELFSKHYSSDVLDDSLIPILNDFDNEQSFMSRVTGLIPKKFWGKSQQKGKPDKRKKKPFKGNRPNTKKGRSKPDLKNQKGGYKEPQKKM
ncbi:glycosyltransferase [Nanoarchaeota archaeon]